MDILNLIVRFLHVITGIAWIGASFYFVMLDNSLRPAKKAADTKNGVFGELWAVHGGGFYHSQKYMMGPQNEALPNNLHWSKWEAYTTWISGFFLMAIIYWYGADIYLIDKSIMALTQPVAIAISVGFIIGGYLIYDRLCKSPIANNDLALGITIFILISVAAYVLTHTFSGRGAFITFGAMLGTIMAANVFFVIIPGQKKVVANLRASEPVNPAYGKAGKQRSVHNTYFTLPVLFTMISNHYALTYSHENNWLILIAISLAGALIRVYFVSRHTEAKPLRWALMTSIFIVFAVIWAMAPKSIKTPINALSDNSQGKQVASRAVEVDFADVQAIINLRCVSCHAEYPVQPGFAAAPKGYMYDTPEQIIAQAGQIYQQTVVLKAMPIGNLTNITEEERQVIARWYEGLEN